MSDRWSEKSLNELAAIEKGSVVPTQSDNSRDAVPYIGAENFTGAFSQFTCDPAAVTCEETDVLMLWDGERSGLCAKNLRGAIGSTVARLRPKNHVDSGFLYYGLSNKFEWIQARRTGTGVPHVPKDLGTWLRIIVPNEVAEQRRIAFVLDTIDEAISKTEAVIAKLKQVRAGLRHDLLTCGLDENGELRDPIAHPEQFKDSAVGRIPKEWDVAMLRNLVQEGRRITYGIVQPGEYDRNGVLLIRGQDYINGWQPAENYFKVSRTLHNSYKRSLTRSDDILICIVGATTGAVNQVPSFIDEANITQTTARIACDERKTYARFCLHVLSSEIGQSQVRKYRKGSAQPGLNLQDVEIFQVPLPVVEEQDEISKRIDSQEETIRAFDSELDKLTALKSGLVSDLLTGSVRVPEEMGNQINSPKA